MECITRFNELPVATELENTWASGYSVIARTNTILNRIGNADLDNPALGERIRGEALFIRALVYYNMAITFGNIPMQLDEVTSPQVEINQVSAEVIYNQIASDLEGAEGLMTGSYTGTDIGRATSGVDATRLVMVYLTGWKHCYT